MGEEIKVTVEQYDAAVQKSIEYAMKVMSKGDDDNPKRDWTTTMLGLFGYALASVIRDNLFGNEEEV